MLHQPVVTFVACVCPVRNTNATSPPPPTYQTFAMLMLQFDLFPPSLKLPLLSSFLFLLIKSVHLLLLLGLLALLILHVLVLPLLQHYLFHHRKTVAGLPPSFLPSRIVVSSDNSLNSSYVARTKPLSFKAIKSLAPKSLPPLKT